MGFGIVLSAKVSLKNVAKQPLVRSVGIAQFVQKVVCDDA